MTVFKHHVWLWNIPSIPTVSNFRALEILDFPIRDAQPVKSIEILKKKPKNKNQKQTSKI
jgi:hypothetical protein